MNQLDYQMGTVVATNGTYVLSGSQLAGDAVSYPGALTLFESINSQWQQVDRYIDANTGGFGTLARAFAFSADISSNALAVGAPIALTGAGQVNTGTVFASTSIFPVGPFLTEVDPPASVPGWSLFGWSVAVTGTTMVVGAPASANVGGTGIATRGAAYVYTLSSGSWTLTQTLQPTPMSGNDHEGFGTAVDASGSNIIVGIPSRTVAGKLALGAVQIFTLVNGQYISGGNFNGPTTLAANAQFGSTVSIGADYAVAGSRNAGTVVVYQRNGNSWSQAAVIAPGPAHFGAAVALEGTRFAAGSPSEDRVYRYERINSAWQLTGTISSPNPTLTFGSSLDIKNSTLVIGDPNATTGTGITTNSGAAYVVPITGF
jgi:hypothetical protein